MPELNGLDTINELRELDKFKNIPIFALTAYTDKDDIAQFSTAGFDEILSKPVKENSLIKIINNYLP